MGNGFASFPPSLHPSVPSSLFPATDPRWVLAVRVRQAMQGPMLPPEHRDRLLKIGRLLGLTPFEANLVIAIVQDQSRQGGELTDATASLMFVPRHGEQIKAKRSVRIGWLVAAAIAAEVVLMFWLFG
ncbi:MAG: hypothetical protein ACYC26_12565 [Phycisphaerales bacterium]